ncbi:Uncharacterised protein [Yersinia intermedia]|uniref:Uncharacterized protein n=1 Tax=Yersinia aldovae TaxID=29483 RepID=A0ABM9SV48_YERAL|nr:Uncharacterised protein [Yersinia intermedia]CNL16639.1 Uncharacterised protein [Yersinia aldovae]
MTLNRTKSQDLLSPDKKYTCILLHDESSIVQYGIIIEFILFIIKYIQRMQE